MLSCIGTKKKKKSKKVQRDEIIQVSKKIYEKLHTINCELREYTQDHKVIIANPNDHEYEMTIIAAIKLYQKQISYIIETINKLEDNLELSKKLEFDVKRIFPLDSLKIFHILEKCHYIDSFFKDYEISILRIKLKETEHMPEIVTTAKANCTDSIIKKLTKTHFQRHPLSRRTKIKHSWALR